MYRINLYREYFERRRSRRGRAARIAALAALVGAEVILVGSLAMSGFLLQERVSRLRLELRRWSAVTAGDTLRAQEVEIGRALRKLRRDRVDWSPKLSALSDLVPSSMVLVEVKGQTGGKGRPGQFTAMGETHDGTGQMETVSRFLERLRQDPRIGGDFPRVRLGTIGEGASTRVQVVCEAAERGK